MGRDGWSGEKAVGGGLLGGGRLWSAEGQFAHRWYCIAYRERTHAGQVHEVEAKALAGLAKRLVIMAGEDMGIDGFPRRSRASFLERVTEVFVSSCPAFSPGRLPANRSGDELHLRNPRNDVSSQRHQT